MRIATVALHHEALTHWAAYRRTRADAPELLTLDFHTDVLNGSRRGVPAPDPEVWRDPEAVAAAVKTLRHDEQIDWALRGGIVRRATVIALASGGAPEHPALTVRRPPGLPELPEMLNAGEEFRAAAGSVLSDDFLRPVLPDGEPEAGFILDLDCDCVLCARALAPEKHALLDGLIRRAGLVTLAREDDWVRLLKLPGETLTGAEIARRLERYCRDVVSAPCR